MCQKCGKLKKKKLWPNKTSSMPTAKINHKRKLVSTAAEIKSTMKKEYAERLRARPVHPQINKLYKDKFIRFKLQCSKNNKSPNWLH